MGELSTLIISNLVTGGSLSTLSWWLTWKSTRRMAAADAADHEATAIAHMQGIYKDMIADLREEKQRLDRELGEMRAELVELRGELRRVNTSFLELEKKVERHSLFCAIAETCKNCVPVIGRITEIIKTS